MTRPWALEEKLATLKRQHEQLRAEIERILEPDPLNKQGQDL